VGRDRGGAAINADAKSHRHRIPSPGKIRAHRFGLERVLEGARVLDRRLQRRAVDRPTKMKKLWLVSTKEPGVVTAKVPAWSVTGWVRGLIAGAVLLKMKRACRANES
jgi:hypothetical protein